MEKHKFKLALEAHKSGRLDEAEERYRALLDWRPEWTYGNLAVLLRVTGRLAEAEEAARESLKHDPGDPRTTHTLAMILLQRGAYEEGWKLNEARAHLRKAL